MSDNGKRVGSPTPSTSTRRNDGIAAGSTVIGRNRAASTTKSILSTKSNKTTSNLQLTGSKKINTAPPWARHEPPSPDGELPLNPVHHFLGTGNVINPNESQQHLRPDASSTNRSTSPGRDASSTSSFRGGRKEQSDIASMTSSAPDQMSEQQQGQAGWWPFSLPPIPIPLRKNSGQQGQGSSLTSPFQSLFSQTQWLMSGKGQEEKSESGDGSPNAPNGSAGGGVTGGDDEETAKPKSAKDRPRVQWLFDRAQVRRQGWMTEEEMRQQPSRNTNGEGDNGDDIDNDDHEEAEDENGNRIRRRLQRGKGMNMQISIPKRGKSAFTASNSKTPGWEQPWTPSAPPRARLKNGDGKEAPKEQDFGISLDDDDDRGGENEDVPKMTKRQLRTQTFRTWILHNNAVPLIIRLLNVTFTTATLAVAISIREVEIHHGLVGAVGSSPVLAIIFAPLTLVHVIVAIYLEYFGKPLGLWRTSGKLLHTLLEMLFICMWSASLSLTFDNFFTSRLGCAPTWTTKWWDHIASPPPFTGQGRYEGGPADKICDRQLALVCLVFFGLALYCGSLVISLFRIFEKVKYHGTDSQWGGRSFGMGGLGGRLGRV